MKRWLSLILAAALLLTAVPALAVRGDAIIARQGQDGFDDYVTALCTIGDVVWMEGGRDGGVYTYDTASGEMTAYSWDDAARTLLRGENYDETGAQTFTYIAAWFAYQDAPCALLLSYSYKDRESSSYQAVLARVRVQDGRASFEEIGTVDWQGLSDELDDTVNLSDVVVVNDTLCALAQGMDNEVVAFLPLDGSAPRAVYLGNVWPDGITSWNGDILIVQNMETAQYALLPFDGDALGAWQDMPENEEAQGRAYSIVQYGDELVYLSGNTLMAFNPETGAARDIANIPVDNGSTSAFVTESGIYVTGGFSGVALRALNREGESGETLTVNDPDNSGEAQNAIVRFMNEQGADVAAVRQDDILTALLTKSTAFDVAILSTRYNSDDLRAILSRGWARPIESEKLAEYVSGMYPAVSSALMQDDQALGVPFAVDVTVPGLSVGALKAMGLTIDDVPTSWPELIDWLNGLIPTATVPLVEEYDEAEAIRRMFIRGILQTYQLELDAGTVSGYDTPELRAALAAVERLDAEGLCELTARFVDGEEDVAFNPLFLTYAQGGVTSVTYQDDYTEIPLYLSLSADLPKRVPLGSYVAIINPYSEHIELATRFLETLAEEDWLASRTMLRPDQNETARSADYERYTSEYDKKIARLEEELKTAEGDAKDVIEQDLANARQTRADMEDWYWIVSAQSLERYRANDAGVVLDLRPAGYSYYDTLEQYSAGQKNMDEFIAALQKQLEMRRMEEQ